MLLNLYSTTDDTRKLKKTLTTVKNITAIPSENVTMLTPAFIVEYDSTILAANYCYIPEFGRYYFIRDITLLKGNRLQINCSVDVLMSFADDIKNCSAMISRSESVGKPTNIPDSSLPINPNTFIVKSILFPNNPFGVDFNTSKCWLLTAIGGYLNANQ